MKVFRSMDALLKKPDTALAAHPFVLLTGAIGCYVLYGLASGFFQGGWSLALAVAKVPLIILASTAICLPSLYVFAGLAGAELSARTFAATVAGFCGITGLILLALMPVIWLFSVSTLSLAFVVFLHVLVWVVALWFGRQFLRRAVDAARPVIGIWLVLLFVVSLQMTTCMRPVLWRSADAPLVDSEKKSFFGHLHDVVEWKPTAPSPNAAAAPAPPR
jgi:hypothetical protein